GREVGDHRGEAVLNRTHVGARGVDLGQRGVHGQDHVVGTFDGLDVHALNAGPVLAAGFGRLRGGGGQAGGGGAGASDRDLDGLGRAQHHLAIVVDLGGHAGDARGIDRGGNARGLLGAGGAGGGGGELDVDAVDDQVALADRGERVTGILVGQGGAGDRGLADDQRRLPHAQRIDVGVDDRRDVDGLALVGADLEALLLERAVEQLDVVEVGGFGDALDVRHQLLDFGVQGVAVGLGVGGVARLHRQLADALQVVADLGQRAFGGLGQRNAVVGV